MDTTVAVCEVLEWLSFFFSCSRHPRDLHSFPTRRSSDLVARRNGLVGCPRPGMDALPIRVHDGATAKGLGDVAGDRKSTRLNSSHVEISYAVFCLKKKK